MSRIQKYKESLQKFIKEKSCLLKKCFECSTCDSCMNCKDCKFDKHKLYCNKCIKCENCSKCIMCDKKLKSYVYDLMYSSDSVYSILFLTVMNNQNKKINISVQGYYIATCVEFLCTLLYVIENKGDVMKLWGDKGYLKLCGLLGVYANVSLQQNIESAKSVYVIDNLINISMKANYALNETISDVMSIVGFECCVKEKECDGNVVDWYLKDESMIKKFESLKQISKVSCKQYCNIKYVAVCEFVMMMGWIMGNGNVNNIEKLGRSAGYFAMMYGLSKNFKYLNDDIKNATVCTTNYVLNFGLQDGYEEFINNKQLFLSSMMNDDVYTSTIKELIDKIEIDVDDVINLTSPDLRSNCSTK